MNGSKHPCYDYFQLQDDQIDWVESTLQSLDRRQRIGQLFLAYMMPETHDAEEQIELFTERIKEEAIRFSLGGYYLNRYHFPSTTMLLNILQKDAAVPLFIAADMESGAGGGFGGVIAPGLTQYPCAMALGAAGCERYAYLTGHWTAQQTQLIGVNYIFAPSCDISNNPENPIINIRSFGENAHEVSRLASAYIRGIQEGGLPASAKHFPGHGDTSDDSHIKLCRVNGDRQRMMEEELYPFMRAIDEARVDSIMTGHLSVPALEPDENLPATFSHTILQNLLRQEFHFEGVIITDAMLMGGVTELCGPEEAAVRAFQAGCDIILMPPDLELAFQGIENAVNQGGISEERLEESVRRILAMKAKYELDEERRTDTGPIPSELLELPDQVSYNIASDSVTLVKNDNKLLPLEHGSHLGVIFMTDTDQPLADRGHLFLHSVSHIVGHEYHLALTPDSDTELFATAHKIIQQFEIILIAVDVPIQPEKDRIDLPEDYAKVIDAVIESGKQVILVSFSNPYLVQRFPTVDAYVCSYQYFDNSALSTVEILFGDRAPHGKLPVTIPGMFDRGTGLSY